MNNNKMLLYKNQKIFLISLSLLNPHNKTKTKFQKLLNKILNKIKVIIFKNNQNKINKIKMKIYQDQVKFK